jgi:DNA-binding NarL/FixJ family response regulator
VAIRILLVEENDIVRQGMGALIRQEPDFDLVGEASDGRAAVELAAELAPDVVIMDVLMSDLHGIEATRMILEKRPDTRVLGLSMHTDLRIAWGFLQAGAAGYVDVEAVFSELVKAIRTVVQGGVYLSRSVPRAGTTGPCSAGLQGDPTRAASLTAREHEILKLLADGHSAEETGSLLGINAKTVFTHYSGIMDKLGLTSTAELVREALRLYFRCDFDKRVSPAHALWAFAFRHKLLVAVAVLCALTGMGLWLLPSPMSGGELTEVTVRETWNGTYPVAMLSRLPEGQRDVAVGYIGDETTFSAIWAALKPSEAQPVVDFATHVVLFARDTDLGQLEISSVYARPATRIAHVTVFDRGSVQPGPGRGSVAMALAVVPRASVRGVVPRPRTVDWGGPVMAR